MALVKSKLTSEEMYDRYMRGYAVWLIAHIAGVSRPTVYTRLRQQLKAKRHTLHSRYKLPWEHNPNNPNSRARWRGKLR